MPLPNYVPAEREPVEIKTEYKVDDNVNYTYKGEVKNGTITKISKYNRITKEYEDVNSFKITDAFGTSYNIIIDNMYDIHPNDLKPKAGGRRKFSKSSRKSRKVRRTRRNRR